MINPNAYILACHPVYLVCLKLLKYLLISYMIPERLFYDVYEAFWKINLEDREKSSNSQDENNFVPQERFQRLCVGQSGHILNISTNFQPVINLVRIITSLL